MGPLRKYGLHIAVVGTLLTGAGVGAGIYYDGQTDVSPPTTAISAPITGATVSGSSQTVAATCSDNVGCVGVQFKLNGVNLGAEDVSGPTWAITWNTTTVTDGTYTLSAVGRDAAGNLTPLPVTSAVIVSNTSGSGTANIWVGNAGTCTPSGSLVGYSAGSACSTAAAALNALPNSGGLIRAKCGTYLNSESLSKTTLTATATITSESGHCATFDNTTGQSEFIFGNNVNDVTLDHLTIGGRIVFTNTLGVKQDNDTISNNLIDVGHIVSGQLITYATGSGLTITGNTLGPSCCGFNGGSGNSPEGIRIGKPSSSATRITGAQTISAGGTLNVLPCGTQPCGTGNLASSGSFVYQGSTFTYTGKSGNTITGVSPGGTFADGVSLWNPPSCTNEACNVTIADNLIQGVVRDCTLWLSGFGSCPDTTCTNANGCHEDGIHIWGVDGANILRNRLYGDECQGIFLENTNNNLNRNVNIIGNAVASLAGGCSNKGIYLSASGSTDGVSVGFAGTWNIGFNSGTSSSIGANGCGSCWPSTVINYFGNNMGQFFTNASGNGAGCGSGSFGSATVHFEYNIWRSGSACGSNDTVATPAFVNDVPAPAAGISDHLGAAGTADNYVPCSSLTFGVCPSVDIDGDSFAATADAGADQR